MPDPNTDLEERMKAGANGYRRYTTNVTPTHTHEVFNDGWLGSSLNPFRTAVP